MPILSLVPGSSLVAQMVKNLPAMRETWVPSLDQEDPLETGMATHSSILAWRISWTEESVHGVAKSQTQHSDYDYYYSYFLCVGWTVSLSRPLKS